ncbi:MAG: 30S ribosomal protein S13 [Planctomycetes bacterium]|jgi:small subunit ribosomal protein S13|nr:30S ribosomal protein S13 [Planctomycetota bacterium]
MPRLLGVDIPADKRLVISLQYIYGVGITSAKQICRAMQLSEDMRAKELTEDQVARLASHIQNQYVVEGQLRRQINQNISRLRDIGCYRGLRHRRGLPVRGQSTKTNARTRKGPRKTVAGKKQVGK